MASYKTYEATAAEAAKTIFMKNCKSISQSRRIIDVVMVMGVNCNACGSPRIKENFGIDKDKEAFLVQITWEPIPTIVT